VGQGIADTQYFLGSVDNANGDADDCEEAAFDEAKYESFSR